VICVVLSCPSWMADTVARNVSKHIILIKALHESCDKRNPNVTKHWSDVSLVRNIRRVCAKHMQTHTSQNALLLKRDRCTKRNTNVCQTVFGRHTLVLRFVQRSRLSKSAFCDVCVCICLAQTLRMFRTSDTSDQCLVTFGLRLSQLSCKAFIKMICLDTFRATVSAIQEGQESTTHITSHLRS
jgi:hypothetical protein